MFVSDPTPEERADTLANTECPHWSEAVPYTCKSECPRCVGKEIRAATAAERERCVSKIEPVLSALRDGGNSGWVDDDILESIIAAIRAEPEGVAREAPESGASGG